MGWLYKGKWNWNSFTQFPSPTKYPSLAVPKTCQHSFQYMDHSFIPAWSHRKAVLILSFHCTLSNSCLVNEGNFWQSMKFTPSSDKGDTQWSVGEWDEVWGRECSHNLQSGQLTWWSADNCTIFPKVMF